MSGQEDIRVVKEPNSETKAWNWVGNSVRDLALKTGLELDINMGHIHRTRIEYGKGSLAPLYVSGRDIDGKTPDPSGGLYFTSDGAGNVAVYVAASGINVTEANKIAGRLEKRQDESKEPQKPFWASALEWVSSYEWQPPAVEQQPQQDDLTGVLIPISGETKIEEILTASAIGDPQVKTTGIDFTKPMTFGVQDLNNMEKYILAALGQYQERAKQQPGG